MTDTSTHLELASPLDAQAERGRKLIVRAILTASLVYGIRLLIALSLGYGRGMFESGVRIALLVGLGALVLRGRQNWARWVLVVGLVLWSIEWFAFIRLGDPVAMLAAPTLIACAVALASTPSRRFVEQTR